MRGALFEMFNHFKYQKPKNLGNHKLIWGT
jgi:hypothetical protein